MPGGGQIGWMNISTFYLIIMVSKRHKSSRRGCTTRRTILYVLMPMPMLNMTCTAGNVPSLLLACEKALAEESERRRRMVSETPLAH